MLDLELADRPDVRELPRLKVPTAPGRELPRLKVLLRASVAVFLLGVLATAVLSWLSYRVNDRTESGLLSLQTKQTGAVLQATLPTIQTPLASAAEIAATTEGNATAFVPTSSPM